MAGQHFQQQRAIFGRLAHRPDLVEAAGEGDQAVAAHAAVGRLQAGDAAQAGRDSGSSRRCRCPRPAGAMRAATAAAEPPLLPPGMRDRSQGLCVGKEGRVLVRPAHGELVHVGPADQHGVGRLQLGHDRGVVGRAEVFQHPRGAGGRLALRAEHVLDGHRQSGQPPKRLARLAAAVDFLGPRQGGRRIDPQERLHAAVVAARCGPDTTRVSSAEVISPAAS